MTASKRLKLHELSASQIEPLEKLFTPGWPDVWKELARSFFCTLLSSEHAAQLAKSAPPGMQPQNLAIALTLGIAKDLGGTQPYIPCGKKQDTKERTDKVLQQLRAGNDYQATARACGITASRVRNIERMHRRAQINKKP